MHVGYCLHTVTDVLSAVEQNQNNELIVKKLEVLRPS